MHEKAFEYCITSTSALGTALPVIYLADKYHFYFTLQVLVIAKPPGRF